MSSTQHLPELESLRSQVAGLARELAERDRAMQTRQQGVDGELQDLRKQSDLLRAIMEGTAADTGGDFFASLATHLTSTLHMQYAVIGEVLEKTPARIRTLAVSSGGTLLDNFEYDLAAAPCGTGLTESFWCFEQGVQTLFPNFPPLAAMGVESHSGVSIRNKQGKVVGLIVVMDTQPIAHQDRLQTLLQVFAPRVAAELQREQAEAARRETERRLRFTQFAVDHAVDGVLWADESRRFIYANDAVCRSLGYGRDELLGLHIADIAPHHDPDRFQRRLDEIKQGGAAIYESIHRRKDGTAFPVETSVTYLEHEGKGYTCGIIRDITARKCIERERLQALADLQNITETVPDIMFTLDTGGNLIRWNGRLAVVTGYRPEELLNKPALAFVPVEEQAQTAEAIQRAFIEGHAELDGHLLTHTGHTIPYHWTGAVLRDSSGQIIGITGIGRDVSEQKQAAESIHRQRHHLLEAQALAHLGSWEWDIESGETDWSEEQFRIFGHKPGAIAVTYDTFLAALLPDDHDRVLAAVNDALLGKSPLDLECRIVRPNGDIRVIHMRADVQRDATAHPIGMAGTALDITERKQAEEALRASEERWHLAVQGSNDGIWDWNIQAGKIFFSARWKAMRGFADHEVSNHIDEWRSRIHPDDLDHVLQSIDHYLAKQTSAFCEEYRVQRKDGSYMWILDRGVALWAEDGTPLRMAGSETDITESKRAEEALAQSRDLLTSFVEHTPAAVAMLDKDFRYLAVSRRWLQDYRLGDQNLIGKHHYDIFPEIRQMTEWQAVHQRCLAGAVERREEDRLIRENGSEDWLRWEVRPWHDVSGEIGGIIMFTEVITERKRAEEALRTSQEKLQQALRASHTGLWDWNTDSSEASFSREWKQQLGYNETELAETFESWEALLHPGDHDRVIAYVQAYLANPDGDYQQEFRLQHKDGTYRWIEARAAFVIEPDGRRVRLLGSHTDITERKQAELALRENEARTRSILETALDAVVSINESGLIIGWNTQAEILFGYSADDVLGRLLDETIIPARYRQAHAHGMNRIVRGGDGSATKRRFEFFALHRSGQEFPVEFAIAASHVDGQPMFTAFIRDITERKQAEEALRESEERYRTLVELSPSGVFVFSEGQLVYVNSMAMTILGATEPSDILARAPFEFIHPDYHEDVTKNLRRVLAGEATVHRAERVYLKMDGTPIHVQVEAVRITWNGKPAIQGFFSDITERKQAEHRLRLTQFTIDHAVEAIYWIDPHANIVDVNEAAREMLGYSKEDLCAMTVHDLNPDFQADMWPGFWAETQRRGTMTFETSHRTRDGRLLPVEIQVNYLSYEGQEFHCAFVRDITERKRAQEELRRSKTRLTYILESNPAVVYTRQVGNGWPFTFITPNVYELLGYTSIDILTDPDRLDQSIHPDDDRDLMTTGMPQLLSNGAQTFVYRLRRRDGRYCWIENRARLNDDGQGTLQIVGTMLDITQRKRAEEALTTSERQLRTVLDSLPIGVWFTDRTGKTLLANPAAKQIWSNIKQVGLQSRENPSGWWETLEPASEPHRWALSHALTTGEVSLNETLDLEDIDGRRKTIRNTTVPVKDESGTTIGAVILNEDLTDLRRIQEALKLTQFSVDHAVEAFFWIGPDAKILHVNEAACRMLEYTSDELTNMTVHDIDPNFPLEAWAAHWEELKQNGALTFESKHWSRTGRVLDTEVTVNYLQYEGSEYNCAIIRDIGERKQAEEALRQSEERFRLLVEGAPLGITLLDEHFCYVKVNQAFCNLVGYREEEILGQTSALFIHPDDRTSNLAVAAEAHRGEGASYRLEKRYIRKNKQPVWVTVNATSLPLQGNTDHHMVAIIENITERKQLAEREASRVRQLKKLSELSMTLSGDPAIVFDQVVRIIGELFNVQVVCLSEIVGEELHFKSVYIDGQILRSEEHCPLAITPCATVAQAKDMRIFDRVVERFPQATFLKDHDAYMYCGFPALDSHGTVVAVTCLLDNSLHEFAEEEHELLRIIGQRIAVEIERSRHISEKQQAEDALRQNHALLSAIMEATMDIVFVKDLDGRYLHMNPAGARVVGLSPQEIVGKNDNAIWPTDLAACCKEADRQILATGCTQTMEESTLANGKRTTYLTTKAPYRDAAGHMIGIIGVAHDISQIKQSEEDLRRSHAFIRQIIDTDPNFIFAKDREGRFTLVNKAVADAYGTTVDHLTGKTDADFNSNTRELAHFRKIDLDVLDSLREQFVPEEMITDAAGRTRWLQTVKRPIMDETGRATMVLGACTDITERKRMEEALRQRERDLRTALDERERISQDLHDGILQSLYAVGLGLEACKPLMTQRHYKKAAASMDRAIGHLNHVMSEVRNFIAGLESQILQGSTFPMALRTMVLTLTADHPIPCTLTIDESLANTFSTEQALHLLNVVREALSNSLRHSGATKTTVSLKSLSRSIRLTIADNGRGFNPASMHGAGHGLTNMEARARKVGGRFAIRSVPQHGTRITIDVPKETSHAESESDRGSPAARR
jgi:PAS domain S-box-containing protein